MARSALLNNVYGVRNLEVLGVLALLGTILVSFLSFVLGFGFFEADAMESVKEARGGRGER